MGIVLISFGVILFLSQINKFSALNLVLKIWPVILILLGLEVLWYRYSYKDEAVAIKYDWFSILCIFLILIVNIGIFAVRESGLMNRIESSIFTTTYDMDASIDEYMVDESIKKIIIDDVNNMVIRSTSDNKISGVGKSNVYATSKAEADELIKLKGIKYEKSGGTLYIYTSDKRKDENNYSHVRNLEIFLPENIDVEVMNCRNLDLVFAGFKNNWNLDGVSYVNVRLDKISNVAVKAFVESVDYLSGNVKWSFNKFGEYVNGNPSNVINIFNGGGITVNEV